MSIQTSEEMAQIRHINQGTLITTKMISWDYDLNLVRSENLLIGLRNRNGTACVNESCDGVLEWADGSLFQFGGYFAQSIVFPEGLGCAHLKGKCSCAKMALHFLVGTIN